MNAKSEALKKYNYACAVMRTESRTQYSVSQWAKDNAYEAAVACAAAGATEEELERARVTAPINYTFKEAAA